MVLISTENMSSKIINFYFEDVTFTLEQKKKLRSWVKTTIQTENFEAGPISYIFCSDKYLHEMNLKYLNHDTYTDIITFDYTENKVISGDLFISYDRVKQNAKSFGKTIKNELHRVMIHGVLHLCNFGDKTESEKTIMRNKENQYLLAFQRV
jgi:probable rRNA maturation factor